jgi:ankyrin repeat protein
MGAHMNNMTIMEDNMTEYEWILQKNLNRNGIFCKNNDSYRSCLSLLQAVASPNSVNEHNGKPVLSIAILEDDLKFAELFLDQGADPNALTTIYLAYDHSIPQCYALGVRPPGPLLVHVLSIEVEKTTE